MAELEVRRYSGMPSATFYCPELEEVFPFRINFGVPDGILCMEDVSDTIHHTREHLKDNYVGVIRKALEDEPQRPCVLNIMIYGLSSAQQVMEQQLIDGLKEIVEGWGMPIRLLIDFDSCQGFTRVRTT